MNEPFPDEIADASWDEAHRRADAIRRFLRDRPDSRSVSDVLDLARELGVSKATAYRLVRAFRAGGTVVSLVDRKRGRPEGHSALDDAREEIIRTTINSVFLTRNRPAVRMRGCGNSHGMAAARRAAFWRPHRTPHRNADGE